MSNTRQPQPQVRLQRQLPGGLGRSARAHLVAARQNPCLLPHTESKRPPSTTDLVIAPRAQSCWAWVAEVLPGARPRSARNRGSDVEDLVQRVGSDADVRRLLADQLAVGDQREQLAEREQVVEVALLVASGASSSSSRSNDSASQRTGDVGDAREGRVGLRHGVKRIFDTRGRALRKRNSSSPGASLRSAAPVGSALNR